MRGEEMGASGQGPGAAAVSDDGPRLPGILFAFPRESAIPTPVEQEREGSLSKTD